MLTHPRPVNVEHTPKPKVKFNEQIYEKKT